MVSNKTHKQQNYISLLLLITNDGLLRFSVVVKTILKLAEDIRAQILIKVNLC